MGAFRDFFNGLYNSYLKEPLMAVQNRVFELKGVVEGKLEAIKLGVSAIGANVSDLGPKIVTGISEIILTQTKSLVENTTRTLVPLTEMVTGVIQVGNNKLREIMIWRLKDAADVTSLNLAWNSTPSVWRSDEVVAAFYEAEKEKLEKQGLNSPTDVVLGYMGKQVAAGIWAIEAKALPRITEWIDTFAEGYQMERAEIESMKSLAHSGEFGLNAVVNFMLGVTLYPAVMSAGEPAWVKLRQEAYSKLPVTLLDPRTLVSLKYKEYIPTGLYSEQFKKLGFTDENTALLEKDFLYYPDPRDFIRFAVRETFKPEVVKEYGYDTDFPDDIVAYAEKAGMQKEWLQHYWRAHWEIPSPRQGYEMLHRGVIDIKGLEMLLKIGDYAPGWVQPLIAISYSPITRVDLRRLYKDGVIDEAKVLRGYLDLGYSSENAMLITQWVVKTSQVEDRELTKAEVLKSFSIGETSKDQAVKFLGLIGYTEANAVFVISYEEYKQRKEERKEEIETIIAELIEGRYTVEEVKTKLSDMDVSIKQSNLLISKADRIIRKRFTLPSKDDCMRWFNAGIINEKVFTQKMITLHYEPDDIVLYLKEVIAEK